MDRHAGWTRKRRDRERFLSGERGRLPGPRTFRLLRIVTESRDQRRAFADNRRARLRAKRGVRLGWAYPPYDDRTLRLWNNYVSSLSKDRQRYWLAHPFREVWRP